MNNYTQSCITIRLYELKLVKSICKINIFSILNYKTMCLKYFSSTVAARGQTSPRLMAAHVNKTAGRSLVHHRPRYIFVCNSEH